MKVVPPKHEGKPTPEVLLPLVSQPKAHTKTNASTFDLKTDPTNNDSPKYNISILRLTGGEDVRTQLQWVTDYQKIMQGLIVNNGHAVHRIVVSLLSGNPANLYLGQARARAEILKTAAIAAVAIADPNNITPQEQTALDAVTNRDALEFIGKDEVENSLRYMITNMMPSKALARVKRHFRRECRKPRDMTVREYYTFSVLASSY